MEGEGENRKANIVFDNFGEKKLILRFAKLRIVEG
jgi:DNA helicase-2/ATP-dependent DNA helicase PcrA